MNGIDPKIVKEAARWLVRLESEGFSSRDQRNFDAWLQASEAHQFAWHAAGKFSSQLITLPRGLAAVSQEAHEAKRHILTRRESMKWMGTASLSILGISTVTTMVPWGKLLAEQKTEVGALTHLELRDGVNLVLNTSTSVDIDRYKGEVWLREGQVLVNAVKTAGRTEGDEVTVQTPMGTTQIMNGKAAIWFQPGSLRVAALDGEVRLHSMQSGARQLLPAGRAAVLGSQGNVRLVASDANDEVWARGLLYANAMPLPEFIEQLARYHKGVLRCSSDLSSVHVSGVYRYADLDGILQLLVNNYPVDIHKLSNLWVSIMPRQGTKTT